MSRPNQRHWWSKAILIGGIAAVAAMPAGALGTRLGLWPFTTGFLILAAGVVLGAVCVVTGIAAIIAVHRGNLSADRTGVYIGTVAGLLVLGLLVGQYFAANSVPPIHDISTDVADPPAFVAVVALRGEGSNPLEYDADRIAALQTQAYPWVQPLESTLAPDDALIRSQDVLEAMGLDIVAVDASAGCVEATDTTFWFGFKDDVVVRVRPSATGSLVDVRSVSRVGVSDLGVNARRIGDFLGAFGSN